MALEIIREKLETGFNLVVGFFGMCCGHLDIVQITSDAAFIANVGGAVIVLIQLYRMLRKKE